MNKSGIKTIVRRRRECKTDYKKRMNLLKSNRARIVFRRTNKYLISQYVISKEAQDSVLITITSKDLLEYGWPQSAQGSLKSITASYLTGYLLGTRIKKEKKEQPIVDLGMLRTIYGTKVFAFIKGLIDSGLEIPCKDEAFPKKERIEGEHMKNKIKTSEIKSKIDKI